MKLQTLLPAIAAVMCSLVATNARAQEDSRLSHDVVTPLVNDTVNASVVERHLKGNAPKQPNINGLPRFVIVGRDQQFYVGIGMQFLGEGVYDYGDNVASATHFSPADLRPETPGNSSQMLYGWNTSSIYLNVVALPDNRNQIGVFFKGNFTGPNNAFHCSHFYTRFRGLTVGRTSGVFTDAEAEPMTIDSEGPNGFVDLSLFTAFWTQKFSKHFSGAIGIDEPTTSVSFNDYAVAVNQRIPAIPVYLQYGYQGGDSHIRVSGILKPMQYRNLLKDENKTANGIGVQLSGLTKVTPNTIFSYAVVYGRGIGSYIQDDNGLGLDAVPVSKLGKLETVRNLGITAGFNYSIAPGLSSNISYSHLVNYLPDKAEIELSQYRYGDYVAANIIYSLNRFVSAGFEYDYGHRKDFDGTSLHANRLQVQLAVTF